MAMFFATLGRGAMTWTLVVIVLGMTPVQTGLLYDNLDACYLSEETMRAEYARSFNAWLEWAKQNPKESSYPASEEDMKKRLVFGVCVPHGNAQIPN